MSGLDDAPERGGALRALLILFLVLAVAGGGLGGVYLWATGSSGPTRQVAVEIPKGSDAGDVGRILDEAGVVRSGVAFRILAGIRGVSDSILPGTYELTTNMGLSEAVDAIEAGPGPAELVTVTIPEGFELEDMAATLREDLGLDGGEFLAAARSGEFELSPYLSQEAGTVEGFLFPKTYDFAEAITPKVVIERLLEQFRQEAGSLRWGRARELGVSRYEAVIVASLIEREARVPQDRRKIAAVIYNRLERGMPLQIDATVQYALPERKERLTFEDLEFPSPYNTYLHPGLPPTPIASPGLASLQAALNPAREDYLYFVVVSPSGRHGFAESYKEFLRLKEQAQS